MWEDWVPKPSDLERNSMLDGKEVLMGDGNLWRLPVLRKFLGGTGLPKVIRRTNGQLVETVIDRYHDLCERGEKMFESILPESEIKITTEFIFDLITDSLSVNYRVTSAEVSLLGLITSECLVPATRALLDIDAAEEYIKKNESGLITEHGT
jgi:hypothetical protein